MQVLEWRDGRLQATHIMHGMEVTDAGTTGEPADCYFRSSAKPLQAIPFIRIMDALGYSAADLALACASHNSEPRHVERAEAMLRRTGRTEDDLRCGKHRPLADVPKPESGWSPLWSNCSGKHAAMLAVCVHKNWPTRGYTEPDHPLQQAIAAIMERAVGRALPTGVDGCTIPTFWGTTEDLAKAWRWLDADPDGRRALDAMAAHSDMVAGENRICTDLPKATNGRFVGKVGAAGLYVVIDRETRDAFCVKADSGSMEAAEVAAAAWVENRMDVDLSAWSRKAILDSRDRVRGHFEVA